MLKTRIIALGEAVAGDDGVAGFVIERVHASLPSAALGDIELLTTKDPTRLLEWFKTKGQVWLVDAVIGASAPGQVLQLSCSDFSQVAGCSVSSHGVNPLQALELCRTLYPGEACATVSVFAVTIDAPRRYSTELSDVVRRAGEQCAELMIQTLRAIHPKAISEA